MATGLLRSGTYCLKTTTLQRGSVLLRGSFSPVYGPKKRSGHGLVTFTCSFVLLFPFVLNYSA